MAAVIGALRAELSASIAQFESDMGRAAGAVGRFAQQAGRMAARVQQAGQTMTIALTAPVIAFGVATGRVAADFEATMNRVQGATGATAAQFQALTRAAREFGRDRSFTATAREAADVMEILARNGVNVTDILGGAARATLTLAAATGAEFGPAADVATAVMQQFGRGASELPRLVDNITGTLLASRFGFQDYAQAIAQGGGVAAAAGVSFEEFNAAIAGTSTQFSSGSDAGTSFKTFIQRLVPQSREAQAEITRLGLSFYDAQGNLRSMADIAGQLHDRLGGLSEQARSNALTTIFGTDAFRTAVGLMQQGREGIEQLTATIARASAQQQMEIRMRGLSGSLIQLRRSFENLALAIADSGLLDTVSGLVQRFTALVDRMSGLPPQVLAVATAFAAIAAAIGPVLVVVGAAVGAVANLAPVVGPVLTALGALATFMTGPFGLAIAAAVAAVIIFRDQIMAVLGFLASEAQRILGPTFQRILADFAQMWTTLTQGPIGQAVGNIVRILGNLLAILAAAFGEQALQLIRAFLVGFEAGLHAMSVLITAVSQLLSGDFTGAARTAFEYVDGLLGGFLTTVARTFGAVINWLVTLVQGFARYIQVGIGAILAWVEGVFPGLPAAMAAAARQAIAWAQHLFNGVRTWIQTHLGPVISWAIGMINNLNNAFAAIRGVGHSAGGGTPAAPAPATAPPPTAPAAPRPPRGGGPPPAPAAAGGGRGSRGGQSAAASQALRDARQVETARQRLAEGIRDLNDQLANGLGGRELPRASQQAEALRRRLADLTEDAQRAGVNTAAFAGQIGTLRAEIQRLETEGLAQEAAAFGRQVDESGRAVREFAQGGLAPLEARLQEVDDSYERLRSRIQAQIDANAQLADRNTAAAASMVTLRGQLDALTAAHTAATAAARAQYEAEARIADLQSQAAVATTQRDIRDLRQASGRNGVMTESQQQLQAIQDQLDQQRIAAATRLAELEAQLAAARSTGDTEQVRRLEEQVAIQRELGALVESTSAAQIQAAGRIQEAYAQFNTGLENALADMLVNWRFDTQALTGLIRNLIRDSIVKPLLEMANQWLTKTITNVLASSIPGFADGGTFNVGNVPGAGIDRHLVAFRARTGENVTVSRPGEAPGVVVDGGRGGGTTLTMNVDARGAGPREIDLLTRKLDEFQRRFKENTWDAMNEGIMRQKVAPPSFG